MRDRVLTVAGAAVVEARVEVWQADDQGFYDVQYADLDEARGRGHLFTDDEGRFAFWSVKPASPTTARWRAAAGRPSARPCTRPTCSVAHAVGAEQQRGRPTGRPAAHDEDVGLEARDHVFSLPSGASTRSYSSVWNGTSRTRSSGAVPGSWRAKSATSDRLTPNTASVWCPPERP